MLGLKLLHHGKKEPNYKGRDLCYQSVPLCYLVMPRSEFLSHNTTIIDISGNADTFIQVEEGMGIV